MRFALTAAVITAAAIAFYACSAPALTPTPTRPSPPMIATVAPSLLRSPTATITSSPFSTTAIHIATLPAPTPSTAPSSSKPRLITMAAGLKGPDDLLFAPDGSLYVSDISDGTVRRLDSSGNMSLILSGLQVPEGLVLLPDGSLVIAEQKTNRLLILNSSSGIRSTFLQLVNRTNQDGVDGIAYDPGTRTIIVPDSPNGTVLRVSEDGKTVTKLVSGLVRPTGAAVESDGSILVVDEYGNALYRLPATGNVPPVLLARLQVPDDVAIDGDGNIYVVSLGDSALHRIDGKTGKDENLAAALASPQGLVLDANGNPVVAEEGSGRIVRVLIR